MCRVNGLYAVLDDVGEMNATWTNLCDSFHDLAEQGDCVTKGCYTTRQGK